MKRWISILLIASLLFTFLPAGGAAQAEPTTHSHSGWTPLSTVSSVGGTLSAGNYYLSSVTNTLSATGSITIDGDVTLCLNGKVLDLRGYAINVRSGDHLTICDCSSATHYGNIGTDGLWQASNSSGNCNLTGGVITSTGSSAGNSSAVSVDGGGSLTLASGNIAGTSTDSSNGGGGVFVYGSNSSFTMEGGSIIGNRADQKNGGGVSVNGSSFTMTDGSISGNTASSGGVGGGVTLNNTNGTSMTLSGNVGITSNTTAANAPSNVYLPQSGVITIGGPLTGSQNIGVSMAQPGIFTSGLSGKGSLANFTSDDSDYSLLSSDGGEAAHLPSFQRCI